MSLEGSATRSIPKTLATVMSWGGPLTTARPVTPDGGRGAQGCFLPAEPRNARGHHGEGLLESEASALSSLLSLEFCFLLYFIIIFFILDFCLSRFEWGLSVTCSQKHNN